MTVRAKFRVSNVSGTRVMLSPVYDSNPESENGRFFSATPGGHIDLQVMRPEVVAAFQVGQAFYVDFAPAEG